MIFIVAKFDVKPENAESFPAVVKDFTEGTRSEPGNLWFEWSRGLDKPNEFVLVEAFTDEGAEPHVNSDHFAAGLESMRPRSPRHRRSSPARSTARAGTRWANSSSTELVVID